MLEIEGRKQCLNQLFQGVAFIPFLMRVHLPVQPCLLVPDLRVPHKGRTTPSDPTQVLCVLALETEARALRVSPLLLPLT